MLVAHYYVDAELQGTRRRKAGCVADSLEMARFGRDHARRWSSPACAHGRNREDPEANHPDARSRRDLFARPRLPVDEFSAFCDAHPDRTVVVYANQRRREARAMVTSSIGLEIVADLHARREDHLGAGSPSRQLHPEKPARTCCCGKARASFTTNSGYRPICCAPYPDAKVLVHPESPENVVAQADVVGSTTQLIDAAVKLDATHFIVATDLGILHKMQLAAPGKTFIAAPTATAPPAELRALPVDGDERPREPADVLERGHKIFVDPAIGERTANRPDARFRGRAMQASGDLQRDQQLFANVGLRNSPHAHIRSLPRGGTTGTARRKAA